MPNLESRKEIESWNWSEKKRRTPLFKGDEANKIRDDFVHGAGIHGVIYYVHIHSRTLILMKIEQFFTHQYDK